MSLAMLGAVEVRCRTLPSTKIVTVFTKRLAATIPPSSAASRMAFVAAGASGLATFLTLDMAVTIEWGGRQLPTHGKDRDVNMQNPDGEWSLSIRTV